MQDKRAIRTREQAGARFLAKTTQKVFYRFATTLVPLATDLLQVDDVSSIIA